MINLARVAPLHCSNTIFEIIRNRYDFEVGAYQEIVKHKVTSPDQDPALIETEEGVKAVDELMAQLIRRNLDFQDNAPSPDAQIVTQPLKWETELNHLNEEEEVFDLIQNQLDFLEYL